MDRLAASLEALFARLGHHWALVAFVLLFAGFLLLGSRLSGWHRLARAYPGHPQPPEVISMPDDFGREGRGGMMLDFNNGESNNAIQLGVDGQGLHFSMSFPFRLFHPPFFVPWREVRTDTIGAPWTDRKTQVRFTFAQVPKVPVDVDRVVAAEIEKRAKGSWKMPPLD